MPSRDETISILKELKQEIKDQYNVKDIGLFGSTVRDEAGEGSDVDILVEFDHPIGFFKFLELEEYLADKVGAGVDLVSRKALKPRIGEYILKEVQMI